MTLRKKECLTDRHCCHSGFTLLEIIVAMALVSIAVLVVFQLFAAGSRSIAISRGHVDAVIRAEEIMRSVLTDDNFPYSASSSGWREGYRYETGASRAFEDRTQTAGAELYQVQVTVYWKEGIRDKSFSLYTLKAADKKI